MKFLILLCTLLLFGWHQADKHIRLESQTWIHGSADCTKNTDPPIQVVRYDANTWILRQNKCVHYEAPFLYLFVGRDRALLTDTGATSDEASFPLFKTVTWILDSAYKKKLPLIVAHTHSHSDHIAADGQFRDQPGVTVVGHSVESIQQYFGIVHWPDDHAVIDLGGREVVIIPIPGHQQSSLAFYDSSSSLMLTGDTFYPGRLYVRDWPAFRLSVKRLYEFAKAHPVAYIVGNHIEMTTTPGVDYPVGTTYQPQEHMLPLDKEDLNALWQAMEKLGDRPARQVLDKFIIDPK